MAPQIQASEVYRAPFPDHVENAHTRELSPEEKVRKIAWLVISVVIFPIGIYQLFILALHQIAWAIFFPAQYITEVPSDESDYVKEKVDTATSKVSFRAPDGTLLEGLFVRGKEHPEKVILAIGGNGAYAEANYLCYEELASSIGCSFFTYNPPGVLPNREALLESDRSCFEASRTLSQKIDTLSQASFAAWNYLHHVHQVELSDIVGYGHSLGGFYGAMGAAYVQKSHPNAKIHFYSDRSFETIPSLIRHFIPIVGPVFALPFYDSEHEITSSESLASLKGEKRVAFTAYDQIIPCDSSVASAIQKKGNTQLSRVVYQFDTEDPKVLMEHNTLLSPSYCNRHFFQFQQFARKALRITPRA